MSMKNSNYTIRNRSRDLRFVAQCIYYCATACPIYIVHIYTHIYYIAHLYWFKGTLYNIVHYQKLMFASYTKFSSLLLINSGRRNFIQTNNNRDTLVQIFYWGFPFLYSLEQFLILYFRAVNDRCHSIIYCLPFCFIPSLEAPISHFVHRPAITFWAVPCMFYLPAYL
jgi:hypothetical protein